MAAMRFQTVLFFLIAVIAVPILSGCGLTFRAPPGTVSNDSAVLQGTTMALNDENQNEQGSYWFEYGETTSYGHQTPSQDTTFLNDGRHNLVFTPVKGLRNGTTHHYRLCGDTGSVFCSGDVTFATLDQNKVDYVVGIGAIWTDRPTDNLTVGARSGPSGENPSGTWGEASIAGSGSTSEQVTCLRVSGGLAIVGTATTFRSVEYLPEFRVHRLKAEPVAGRDPTVCPTSVGGANRSIEGLDPYPSVEVNDAPAATQANTQRR